MKTNNAFNLKESYSHIILFLILVLLSACGGKSETGSCNQFCGSTQRISVQSRGACAALGEKSTCPTKWLPHGANPDDRNAWITVYPPVEPPSVAIQDTTPPSKPSLAIELTANNEISLQITPSTNESSLGNKYEVTRNGKILASKYSGKYTYRSDSMLDEFTNYCYSVVAIDAAGNRSVSSGQSCLTTLFNPLLSSVVLTHKQNSSNSVVDTNGTIYGGLALNALSLNGTLQWTSTLPVNSVIPVIGNDGVIYTHSTRTVYGLLADGTLSWSYELTGQNVFLMHVSSDTIYTTASKYVDIGGIQKRINTITALNLDGSLKWEYTDAAQRSVALKFLAADGTPYLEVRAANTSASGPANQIQALNLDGTLKWEYEDANNSELLIKTVGAASRVYLEAKIAGATYMEDTFKLQVINSSGTLDWEYPVLSPIRDIEPASDGTVYLSSDSPRFATPSNQSIGLLEALGPNGILLWNYKVDLSSEAVVFSTVLVAFDDILLANNGKLFFSDGYSVHSLNADGTTNWDGEGTYTGYYKNANLQLLNNRSLVYLDARSGNVKLISYSVDGTLNWRYALADEDAYYGTGINLPVNQPLQVLDKVVIFGGTNLLTFDANN